MPFPEQAVQDENPLVSATELTGELGDECDAYVAGDYLAYARCHGLPLSAWMWLNEIAHGSPDHVAYAAANGSRHGWDGTSAVLAQALLAATAGTDTSSIQRSVLVPLELELIDQTVTPRRLVELATSRLFDAEVRA